MINVQEIEAWLERVLQQLGEPFPPEAIQRTKTDDHTVDGKTVKGTRRGYDTTGYAYQYLVDRFNKVVGIGRWRASAVYDLDEYQTKGERPRDMFDVTALVTVRIGVTDPASGRWITVAKRQCHGGHASTSRADAHKGAFTNGFKKTAALYGCGADAYRGEIDDDNHPLPAAAEDRTRKGSQQPQPPPANNRSRSSTPRKSQQQDQPPPKNDRPPGRGPLDEPARLALRMAEIAEAIGKEKCAAAVKHLGKLDTIEKRREAVNLLEAAMKGIKEGVDASIEYIFALAPRADMSPENIDDWSRELYGRPVKDLDAGFRANFAKRLEEAVKKIEDSIENEPGSRG
jgi:hypothetical protein